MKLGLILNIIGIVISAIGLIAIMRESTIDDPKNNFFFLGLMLFGIAVNLTGIAVTNSCIQK